MIYLAITKETVYHEGDERSRTNPGHGYPAYTETVDCVTRFTTKDQLTNWLKTNKTAEVFECIPMQVSYNVNVEIKYED